MKLLVKLAVIFFCVSGILVAQPTKAVQPESDATSFSFVFMTDIHIQPRQNAVEGFEQAISLANSLHPDFVITGGDLVMDALAQPFEIADSLFRLYVKTSKRFKVPVYNTIGNHEHFGVYKESKVSTTHPEYGSKMFERYLGKPYYSFNHKGWHFIILNSVAITSQRRYIGLIDKQQMEWIEHDLANIAPTTPIIVSSHIPLISLWTPVFEGNMKVNDSSTVVTNAQEVLKLFSGYNLRLVLQGHQHFYEDITYQFDGQSLRFITAGAVCASWWNGPERGLQEGFLKIDIKGSDIETRYIDYQWDAVPSKKE